MKKKLVSLLLVLVLVVLTVPVIGATAEETTGKVIVHFYSSDNQYKYSEWNKQSDVRWGAYYWLGAAKIVESGTYDEQEIDNEFKHSENGVVNCGRIFRIDLTESETEAAKQGKKMGLIMVRSFVDSYGKLSPYWCGNAGKDISADRYITLEFDEHNECHIWIIAGDKHNYTTLSEAAEMFEKVQSAKFDDFDNLLIQTSKAITKNTVIQLYKDTDLTDEDDGELYKDNLKVSTLSKDGKIGTVSGLDMTEDFDWNADYKVYIADVSKIKTSCIKSRLYLSDKFANDCVPDSDVELGAIYTAESTTFRLWAPVSTNVVVNFYRNGNEMNQTAAMPAVDMKLTEKGVWEAVVEGNLNGVYYTYTNYVEGGHNEVVDVYAKAVGVNGNRAMVCDMSATNPENWEQDLNTAQSLRSANSKNAVIWEIHVRDFSVSPDSGITYKGKYLAFTEQNTHVKGNDTLKTGISYLKDLGINYVHLNPVYDFETVDEDYVNNRTYNGKQNWGYDPKNYNVPDGSYSTNPYDGDARINEFKQMVQALHNAGIGVIMDVVYNHTYTSDSWFDKTVPGYYYRQSLTDDAGSFGHKAWSTNALGLYNMSNGSGCSNETASERAMYRRYMIDSLVYWATEYHIDGFRFDLMGIHDVETMNQIRTALNALPGGNGILMYGEPWAADSLGLDAKDGVPANSDHLNDLYVGIAAFNDRMREGVKGGNSPSTGYVQGNMGMINKVMAGINGLFLNYSGEGVISEDPSHTITYTTAHDNYTLWDQLIHTTVGSKSPTVYSEYNSVIEKKNMVAATLVLTSKGTSFILAGEEIARTKYGNHNSYNAQDKINAFDYYRQEDFSRLYNWYKGLIELRTKRFTTMSSGKNQAVVTSDEAGHISYVYTRENASDAYKKLQVFVNPFAEAWQVSVSGSWTVIADGRTFDFDSTKAVSGKITIPAYAAVIVVQK